MSQEELRKLYNQPNERAVKKNLDSLDIHATNFIQLSPFVVISTCNEQMRMDTSPRGGKPGFVKIVDNNTILIPDYKGNNRLDSLNNIVATGRIGMLFLIPGVDETLRVNGAAHITTDQSLLTKFEEENNLPKCCISVSIEEVFLHCAKALMRSELWEERSKIDRKSLPTLGQMLKDQIGSNEPAESQEAMIARYKNDL